MALRKFAASSLELNLEPVLLNGQTFRWTKTAAGVFYGVARGRLWRVQREDTSSIGWRVVARAAKGTVDEDEAVLRDYFQMNVRLSDLYTEWKDADSKFEGFLDNEKLQGIRVVAQEPLECLLAFICSANNNIKRISKLVNSLATLYGRPLAIVEERREFDEIVAEHPWLAHAFPSIDDFAEEEAGMEGALRRAGFGYRAAYVSKTVARLREVGVAALEAQKSASTKDAKAFLMEFAGVGPKVADCVMLMSLSHASVVPLDVHMWNITRSLFLPSLPAKATTSRYEDVAAFYLGKFGPFAGWAQAVLFNVQLGKKETETSERAPDQQQEKEAVVEKKRRKKA